TAGPSRRLAGRRPGWCTALIAPADRPPPAARRTTGRPVPATARQPSHSPALPVSWPTFAPSLPPLHRRDRRPAGRGTRPPTGGTGPPTRRRALSARGPPTRRRSLRPSGKSCRSAYPDPSRTPAASGSAATKEDSKYRAARPFARTPQAPPSEAGLPKLPGVPGFPAGEGLPPADFPRCLRRHFFCGFARDLSRVGRVLPLRIVPPLYRWTGRGEPEESDVGRGIVAEIWRAHPEGLFPPTRAGSGTKAAGASPLPSPPRGRGGGARGPASPTSPTRQVDF